MMLVRLMVPPVFGTASVFNCWPNGCHFPFIWARFTEAMDHAPLPAVHKTKVQAIRTYAEALFPAPRPIRLRLEMGAPLGKPR